MWSVSTPNSHAVNTSYCSQLPNPTVNTSITFIGWELCFLAQTQLIYTCTMACSLAASTWQTYTYLHVWIVNRQIQISVLLLQSQFWSDNSDASLLASLSYSLLYDFLVSTCTNRSDWISTFNPNFLALCCVSWRTKVYKTWSL